MFRHCGCAPDRRIDLGAQLFQIRTPALHLEIVGENYPLASILADFIKIIIKLERLIDTTLIMGIKLRLNNWSYQH
jgi:hypothetical protein